MVVILHFLQLLIWTGETGRDRGLHDLIILSMVLGYLYFLLCGFISLVIWVPWAKRILLLNLAVRMFRFCSIVFFLVSSSKLFAGVVR